MVASLSESQLIALSWTLTSASILLSIGRYLLRRFKLGRFLWDDAAHAVALITLIGLVAEYTALLPVVYQIDRYALRQAGPPSAAEYLTFLKLQLSVSILWWVCLYSVKLAFLLLYRTIFAVSEAINLAWWGVTVFTLLTFWVCVAGELTACGPSYNLLHDKPCESDAGKHDFVVVLIYSGVVHVLSDIAIMALPMFILRKLQMPFDTKLALAAIFSLATLVVVFDLVRTVISVRGGAVGAQSALWDIVEATVAVMVSCLPAYRVIFIRRSKPTQGQKPAALGKNDCHAAQARYGHLSSPGNTCAAVTDTDLVM